MHLSVVNHATKIIILIFDLVSSALGTRFIATFMDNGDISTSKYELQIATIGSEVHVKVSVPHYPNSPNMEFVVDSTSPIKVLMFVALNINFSLLNNLSIMQ